MDTSTPRQEPSWGKRGGGGEVTMISRGVEISIAEGLGEMVRVLLSGLFVLFFIFYIMYSFLGTSTRMQR